MFSCFFNLDVISLTIIFSMISFIITVLGSSLVFAFKRVNKLVLDIMLSVSAGIMLSAAIWGLLEPAINISSSLSYNPLIIVSLGILCGALVLFIGDIICDKLLRVKNNINKNSLKRCIMLVISITLHNIPEGIAIGVAFGALLSNFTEAGLVSAIILSIGIGIQNFPEGCAISLPLRREGLSCFKSFMWGVVSAIVEPIAAILGVLLVVLINNIMPFLLAFAGGAMIYVVLGELVPESLSSNKKGFVLIMVISFILMMALDIAFG